MKTTLTNNRRFFRTSLKVVLLFAVMVSFTTCRMDEDMNYRIVIENNCDFALKVYYDNQDIERHDDYPDDYSVTGAVSIVYPYDEKEVYSKYTSVWVEPVDQTYLKSRKFRSVNDGAWRKRVDVYKQDFERK